MSVVDMRKVTMEAISLARELGLTIEKGGTLFIDEKAMLHVLGEALREHGVIYATMDVALKEYPDIVEEYKISKIDLRGRTEGILLYVPPNTELSDPVSTCYSIARRGVIQKVYNLYVIERGSRADATTGCTALTNEGAHFSVTDVYLGEGARSNSLMIHNWKPGIEISMSKNAKLMDRAYMHAFYVNLSILGRITSMTRLLLEGEGSRADTDTIVSARGSGRYDYISIAELVGDGSSSELISRIVGLDEATVKNVLKVRAYGRGVRGHVECNALQLSPKARISTLPELESVSPDANLTHEASIGKISPEQLHYLFTRGFDEEEAISLVVKGFMGSSLEKVPEKLKPAIKGVLDQLSRASM